MNVGLTSYQLAYEISPIILTGGLAQLVPGNMLPLVCITQIGNLSTGLLHASININFDDFYAHFQPVPGGTLHNNQIGKYPFANQQVAGNAIIMQPLNVSMLMKCYPTISGGMVSRLMTATTLKTALDNHHAAGGTYTILTPACIYTGCIMTAMTDVSTGASKHPQTEWKLDFEQPLLSEAQATTQLSNLMGKITAGEVLPKSFYDGNAWSGLGNQVGSYVTGQTASVLGSVKSALPFLPSTQAPAPISSVNF